MNRRGSVSNSNSMGMVIDVLLTQSHPLWVNALCSLPSMAAAGNSVCTWRALSSPRHACGLNRALFLHPPQVLSRGLGWACSGIDGGEKACESLRG